MNRNAFRWLYVFMTLATQIVPGCVLYLLLAWKGPRPINQLSGPPPVIYKGVCARIADRFEWDRRTFRTIYGFATAVSLFLPGFGLYHVLRLTQKKQAAQPQRKRSAPQTPHQKIRFRCPECNRSLQISSTACGKSGDAQNAPAKSKFR